MQEPEGSPAGSVQLILSDKAKWNATGASAITRFAGGSSYDDAGSIFQKAQAGDLNIANYSGYTNVFMNTVIAVLLPMTILQGT